LYVRRLGAAGTSVLGWMRKMGFIESQSKDEERDETSESDD
jgi:hypothetical protein